MENNRLEIEKLQQQINELSLQHSRFATKLYELQNQLLLLQDKERRSKEDESIKGQVLQAAASTNLAEKNLTEANERSAVPPPFFDPKYFTENKQPAVSKETNISLEKLIGENIINKIGILITIIGVGIGAKYSIEHQLISPSTRILLGYLLGLGLVGIGAKLKSKYENYSAVLVSGAIAILYTVTYFAYSLYNLIPQPAAFVLMFIFTAFAVFVALKYNKPLIAHLGLVGSYAVPFLLSDGSGKVEIMFTYMAIINLGILIVAFKKSWNSLYFLAFGVTWLIFIFWYLSKYNSTHFDLALLFSTVFFAIFYGMYIAQKAIEQKENSVLDILLLLLNSFIYFVIGYALMSNQPKFAGYLGLFTLWNALIHFFVGVFFFKNKQINRNVFYLTAGVVLVFLTLAIPIQLDGNWVTLFWILEAVLLFILGRTKQIGLYEKISYVLVALAVGSLLQDWAMDYPFNNLSLSRITPIFNTLFLTSFVVIMGLGVLLYVDKKHSSEEKGNLFGAKLFGTFLQLVFLGISFASFGVEIINYWRQQFNSTVVTIKDASGIVTNQYYNSDCNWFQMSWLSIYALVFASVILLSMRKLSFFRLEKQRLFLVASAVLFLTMLVGLFAVSELRESYYTKAVSNQYFTKGGMHIGIRYILIGAILGFAVLVYQAVKSEKVLGRFLDIFIALIVIWLATSELFHWMDIMQSTQSYKLVLSIFWGIISIALIIIGIWKNKQHLRVLAIVLFAITLGKLFFYDIAYLSTISKTIVFVSLGIFLLFISFLYNKYKYLIFNRDEEAL